MYVVTAYYEPNVLHDPTDKFQQHAYHQAEYSFTRYIRMHRYLRSQVVSLFFKKEQALLQLSTLRNVAKC